MQRKKFQNMKITFLKIQSLTVSLKRRINISQLQSIKEPQDQPISIQDYEGILLGELRQFRLPPRERRANKGWGSRNATMEMTILNALFLGFFPVASSIVDVTQVKLYEPATLPCVKQCSGVVQWISIAGKEVVAEYNQDTCKNERGYKLSHEKILAGDLSLTIISADFGKKGWYTCACDGRDICTVSVRIQSQGLSIQIKPNKALVLDLPVREPVEVIYNSKGSDGSPSQQICTVEGRSLQCNADYKERVSLDCALHLKEMMASDHGTYIIKDTKNKEIISTYNVTVQDEQPLPVGSKCTEHTGALVALVMMLIGSWAIIFHLIRKIRHLQKKGAKSSSLRVPQVQGP
ncbi:hypothetical protein MHYP_G00260680 [Metynnis hypsauchen]